MGFDVAAFFSGDGSSITRKTKDVSLECKLKLLRAICLKVIICKSSSFCKL